MLKNRVFPGRAKELLGTSSLVWTKSPVGEPMVKRAKGVKLSLGVPERSKWKRIAPPKECPLR